MYRKGDIGIGDPWYYIGKYGIMKSFGLKQKDQVFIKIDKSSELYIIGYKKQVEALIQDLQLLLTHLK